MTCSWKYVVGPDQESRRHKKAEERSASKFSCCQLVTGAVLGKESQANTSRRTERGMHYTCTVESTLDPITW